MARSDGSGVRVPGVGATGMGWGRYSRGSDSVSGGEGSLQMEVMSSYIQR